MRVRDGHFDDELAAIAAARAALPATATQQDIARALGVSNAWLTKRVRVAASPACAGAVRRGELTLEHAYTILCASAMESDARRAVERACAHRLSREESRADTRWPRVPDGRGADPAAAARTYALYEDVHAWQLLAPHFLHERADQGADATLSAADNEGQVGEQRHLCPPP